MMQAIAKQIKTKFQARFGTTPAIYQSPGRVNIIGEHTDYNNGFVLPAAINKSIVIGISKRTDDVIALGAEEFNDTFETTLSNIAPSSKSWVNYILGIVHQVQQAGLKLSGFNLNVDGDVPIGSGMSSSAAMECAVAFALNDLFKLQLSKKQMASMAQQAEHEFAGVRVGIMDMFASLFGKKDHVIQLDCQSLQYQYVPLHLKQYKIVLFNTNVKHALSSSEYNERRQQCEEGVALIQKHLPHVKSLRDADMAMLTQYVQPKSELIYRRCKYVVQENSRLLAACNDLRNGDLDALGQQMYLSHQGLSSDYEVSCRELDFLVEEVRNRTGVLGARMMGGGFGGCTINIVREDVIENLAENLAVRYKKNMHLQLSTYIAETADGTGKIELKD